MDAVFFHSALNTSFFCQLLLGTLLHFSTLATRSKGAIIPVSLETGFF
jgi:hypothetical protein